MFVRNLFTSTLLRGNLKTKAFVFTGSSLSVGGFFFANRFYASSIKENALSPDEFREFTLKSVTYYNHNTNLFRIEFPSSQQESGLTTASFLLVKGEDKEGKEAVRPYTPINPIGTTGYVDLLIKKYPEGNVSRYVHDLRPGDKVSMKGPFKKLDYHANMKKSIGMIAGGTGITPMLQVMNTIFENPADTTKVSLIFANISKEDILCIEDIERYQNKFPDRFHVYPTLDNPPENWNGGKGFVTASMVKENLPEPSDDHLILFCGPPPMLKAVAGPKGKNYTQGEVGGILKELG